MKQKQIFTLILMVNLAVSLPTAVSLSDSLGDMGLWTASLASYFSYPQ